MTSGQEIKWAILLNDGPLNQEKIESQSALRTLKYYHRDIVFSLVLDRTRRAIDVYVPAFSPYLIL